MEHPCCIDAPGLAEDSQRVVFRLAGVDDHGQIARPGHAQLRPEHGLLHLARREVVVIVEADLTHGPCVRQAGEPALHQPRGVVGVGREQVRVMRMHADRGPCLGPQLVDP